MREYELKPVLALMNGFTSGVRDTVVGFFQEMRRQDDAFTQQLYLISRSAFTKNLRAAIHARDTWCSEKVSSD